MSSPDLNKFDIRLLQKIHDRPEGWWFCDGRSLRPFLLEKEGLLKSELRLRRRLANGSSEYAKAYALTDEGRAALSSIISLPS